MPRIALAVFVVCVLASFPATAQTLAVPFPAAQIAFFDGQRVAVESEAGQAALAELDAFQTEASVELADRNQALLNQRAQLDAQASVLSGSARLSLEQRQERGARSNSSASSRTRRRSSSDSSNGSTACSRRNSTRPSQPSPPTPVCSLSSTVREDRSRGQIPPTTSPIASSSDWTPSSRRSSSSTRPWPKGYVGSKRSQVPVGSVCSTPAWDQSQTPCGNSRSRRSCWPDAHETL